MRILKYLFLLFILFFIGLTVFVTTQKGEYDIIRTKVIKTPRATVFNYVNEYRNWETFVAWSQEDAEMKFKYNKITFGKGASYSWKGNNSEGNIKTLAFVENESIHQKMTYDESPSEVFWTFKDTLGATKVTWRTKGKMTAMMKIYTFFKGGIETIGAVYEKSLVNLDRTLDYEINMYAIKVNGIVNRPKNFYISQTVNSYEKNVVKNIKIMVPNMIHFFKKNKIVMSGKPFVIYNETNQSSDIVNFSVCIPIKDSIYIMPGSDVNSGKIASITYLKTTLTGDYSHLKEMKKKAISYLQKNNLKQNNSNKVVEVYSKTKLDIKNPSRWITELYLPIYSKPTAIKPTNVRVKDSASTTVQAEPTERVSEIKTQ